VSGAPVLILPKSDQKAEFARSEIVVSLQAVPHRGSKAGIERYLDAAWTGCVAADEPIQVNKRNLPIF
jgi:hypothetical protein